MAIVANTLTTYAAVGNREDLVDQISMISPDETPFLSMIDSVTSNAVKHEWMTDTLAAPATNAQLEGDEASFSALGQPTRLDNLCQIFRKTGIVSGTQDAVDKAGRKVETIRQKVKKYKELKLDIEYALLSNQLKTTGNTTTARQLHGLCGWLTTNVSRGSGGANGSPTTPTAATDGTQRAFTEDLLLNVHKSCYENGGKPTTLMTGTFNKMVSSRFTGGATKTNDVKDNKITASVDIYQSDFGVLNVVPNRVQRGRDAWLLDPSMFAVAYLRPVKDKPLPATGDAEKFMMIAELTLEVRNEASSGVIADLTTS